MADEKFKDDKPGFTPARVEVFLNELMATANITRSAKLAGIGITTLYRHKNEDPKFAEAWYYAEQIGLDAVEDEVTRRGVEGWDEPVFYKGEQTGVIRKYSDTLLMFKLNGRRPDVFKYRPAIGGGAQDAEKQLAVNINIGFANGGPGQPPAISQREVKQARNTLRLERSQQTERGSEETVTGSENT